MHLAEFIVHGVCSENSSCLFISFVDLSHLIPLNSHKYELLCLVRQGTCHDTLCPVKCARMRAAILSEPRQYGYPHLLIRENRSACLCGFILMGVYNPPCFPLGQDPDCFWWQPHWEFVFDLWVSSALGLTHFTSQLGSAWGSCSSLLLNLLPCRLRRLSWTPGAPHICPCGRQRGCEGTPSKSQSPPAAFSPVSSFLSFLST